jgi:hypothetical protein
MLQVAKSPRRGERCRKDHDHFPVANKHHELADSADRRQSPESAPEAALSRLVRRLTSGRGYEVSFAHSFRGLLVRGDCVWDIGANVGDSVICCVPRRSAASASRRISWCSRHGGGTMFPTRSIACFGSRGIGVCGVINHTLSLAGSERRILNRFRGVGL